MKQLTYQDIVNMVPCQSHYPDKYIPITWTGTIIDILRLPNVAPTEKLWVAYKVLDDKTLRLFAVDCARRALGRVAKPDIRSLIAVNMAEAYAHGRCTAEEMRVARQGSYAAADAAASYATASYAADAYAAANYAAASYTTASYAADAAAADAAAYARKQECETQIVELIRLIEEDV